MPHDVHETDADRSSLAVTDRERRAVPARRLSARDPAPLATRRRGHRHACHSRHGARRLDFGVGRRRADGCRRSRAVASSTCGLEARRLRARLRRGSTTRARRSPSYRHRITAAARSSLSPRATARRRTAQRSRPNRRASTRFTSGTAGSACPWARVRTASTPGGPACTPANSRSSKAVGKTRCSSTPTRPAPRSSPRRMCMRLGPSGSVRSQDSTSSGRSSRCRRTTGISTRASPAHGSSPGHTTRTTRSSSRSTLTIRITILTRTEDPICPGPGGSWISTGSSGIERWHLL